MQQRPALLFTPTHTTPTIATRDHCRESIRRRHYPLVEKNNGQTSRYISTGNDDFAGDKPATTTTVANYHLVWSSKVPLKITLTTLSLWVTFRRVPWEYLHGDKSWLQHRLLVSGIIPTLASACCWIQLLLNMVSAMGCAGFNTYLGPLRPFFLSLLLCLTLVTRHQTSLLTTIARWTVALLPELLHLWNSSHQQRNWWKKKITNNNYALLSEDKKIPTGQSDTEDDTVVVSLDIPTMGCVACIQKVDSSLRQALPPNSTTSLVVTDAKSWLLGSNKKGGRAQVECKVQSSSETRGFVDPDELSLLVKAVEDAGFSCSVESVQTKTVRSEEFSG